MAKRGTPRSAKWESVVNQHPGILGIKAGMAQIFLEDGTVVPCTVVRAGCVVIGKRTAERDGYSALVLGLDERKAKHTSKAVRVALEKVGQTPKRHVQELRCTPEFAAGYELGQVVKVEQLFEPGQKVDVRGRSKGHGFSGVMRRHNFAGAVASHGAHETQRHAGSIGMNMTPGRVLKGHRMCGQWGNVNVTVQNLRVAKVDAAEQLVLIEGAVPGPRSGVVVVRGAVKKRGGKPAAKPAEG